LCGKSQKLSAIETIEEFSIFAESLNVLRPPFELRRSPLILLDFLAGLTNIVALSRARGTRRDLTGPTYGVFLADPGHFAKRHGMFVNVNFLPRRSTSCGDV
jgi:hypothetical protein